MAQRRADRVGEYLFRLARALRKKGLVTRFHPWWTGGPKLVVSNPKAAGVDEMTVVAAPRNDSDPSPGEWWYWWSDGGALGPVDQLDETVWLIVHALTGER